MPILRYLRKNLNAKRFSEYVSNHLSTLKKNKKITIFIDEKYLDEVKEQLKNE